MASRYLLRLPLSRGMLPSSTSTCFSRTRPASIQRHVKLFSQSIAHTRCRSLSSMIRPAVHFSKTLRFTKQTSFKFSTLSTRLWLPRIRQPCKQTTSKRFNSSTTKTIAPKTSAPGPAESEIPTASLSLGQRMKKLSKEYGYSAVAVYLLLTVIDLPFCFLTVRYVGTDTIAKYEHAVIAWFWHAVDAVGIYHYKPKAIAMGEPGYEGEGAVEVERSGVGKSGDEKGVSIWTELALAYALHKSLIFFRVPLTAAVTPKIVQKLRGWGFNIGNKRGIREGVSKNFPRKAKEVVE